MSVTSLEMIDALYCIGPRKEDGRTFFEEKFRQSELLDEDTINVLSDKYLALFDVAEYEIDTATGNGEENLYRFRLFMTESGKEAKLIFTFAAFQNTETNSLFIEIFKTHHSWKVSTDVLREFLRMGFDKIDTQLRINNISLEILDGEASTKKVQIFENFIKTLNYKKSATVTSPSRSTDTETWVIAIYTK